MGDHEYIDMGTEVVELSHADAERLREVMAKLAPPPGKTMWGVSTAGVLAGTGQAIQAALDAELLALAEEDTATWDIWSPKEAPPVTYESIVQAVEDFRRPRSWVQRYADSQWTRSELERDLDRRCYEVHLASRGLRKVL